MSGGVARGLQEVEGGWEPHGVREVSAQHQSWCNVVLCRCRNGRLHGKCWKFLPGGGALYGNIGVDDKISGDDVVYLYPDFLTAIKVKLLCSQIILSPLTFPGSFQR